MTGTTLVLVIVLIGRLMYPFVLSVAMSWLAKRNGQYIESVSWSSRHGFTAKFFEPKSNKSGNNSN